MHQPLEHLFTSPPAQQVHKPERHMELELLSLSNLFILCISMIHFWSFCQLPFNLELFHLICGNCTSVVIRNIIHHHPTSSIKDHPSSIIQPPTLTSPLLEVLQALPRRAPFLGRSFAHGIVVRRNLRDHRHVRRCPASGRQGFTNQILLIVYENNVNGVTYFDIAIRNNIL